jgi:hypothetical protein
MEQLKISQEAMTQLQSMMQQMQQPPQMPRSLMVAVSLFIELVRSTFSAAFAVLLLKLLGVI